MNFRLTLAKTLQKLKDMGPPALADAMGGKNVLDHHIQLQTSDSTTIAGIAETVHILQKSLDPIRSIFKICGQEDKTDILLVIDASGLDGAVWGEIFTRIAMRSNIIGSVIDGGARDIVDIEELGFPVWARYLTPRVITGEWATTFTPGFDVGTHVSVPIICGGVLIRPGDFIVAGKDGIVSIPKEDVQGIVAKAKQIIHIEQKMM